MRGLGRSSGRGGECDRERDVDELAVAFIGVGDSRLGPASSGPGVGGSADSVITAE